MAAGRTLARVMFGAILASACAAPPVTDASARARPMPAPMPARGAPRRIDSVNVLVRRTAEGEWIEISGTSAGTVRLGAESGIVDGRGKSLGRDLFLAPASPTSDLELDGRRYPGRLRVRASARGGLEIVNQLDLERYVEGVLAAELSLWSALPAELEAQAVAARSYTVHAMANRPYLFGDVRDQAYGNVGDPDRGYVARLAAAVEKTRGCVLVEAGRVVDARFHAACGGRTAPGKTVFPETSFACLRAVDCAPCTERSRTGHAVEAAAGRGTVWTFTAPRDALDRAAQAFGLGPRLLSCAPAERDAAGRWLAVELKGPARSRVLRFEQLRHQLGPSEVESSNVVRTWPRPGELIEGGLYLEGRGRGHGVGLCQEGARGYARRGWSAERILGHYYPGARTARLD